jgi:hypothetical protein
MRSVLSDIGWFINVSIMFLLIVLSLAILVISVFFGAVAFNAVWPTTVILLTFSVPTFFYDVKWTFGPAGRIIMYVGILSTPVEAVFLMHVKLSFPKPSVYAPDFIILGVSSIYIITKILMSYYTKNRENKSNV